jgi:hypothetical protein
MLVLATTDESLQGMAIFGPCKRPTYSYLYSICGAEIQIFLKTETFSSSYNYYVE